MKKLNFLTVLLSALLVSGSVWAAGASMNDPKVDVVPEPQKELTENPTEFVKKVQARKIAVEKTSIQLQASSSSPSHKVTMGGALDTVAFVKHYDGQVLKKDSFTSFNKALEWAQVGDTIVLLQTIADSVIIGKSITLDLQTYCLQGKSSFSEQSVLMTITNNSNVAVVGASGSYLSLYQLLGKVAVVEAGSTLTLGGSVYPYGGDIDVSGGSLVISGSHSSQVCNINTIGNTSNITILTVPGYYHFNIRENATIINKVANWSPYLFVENDVAFSLQNDDDGSILINTGTFKSPITFNKNVMVSGGYFANEAITGLSLSPNKKWINTYEESLGVCKTVADSSLQEVASVSIGGDTLKFCSLQDAFNAVPTNDSIETNVTLLCNANEPSDLFVNGGRCIKLDLAGKRLSFPTQNSCIYVSDSEESGYVPSLNDKLTVINGTIQTTKYGIFNYGNLILNNVTIDDGAYSIVGGIGAAQTTINSGSYWRTYNVGTMTVNDGNFTGKFESSGTLTINNGTFVSYIDNYEKLTINNGTFNGVIYTNEAGDTTNISGGFFKNYEYISGGAVYVNGGYITSSYRYGTFFICGSSVNLNISGGTIYNTNELGEAIYVYNVTPTITIGGNSEINAIQAAYYYGNGGTLTINGGKINGYFELVGGKFVVNGGEISSDYEWGTIMVNNAYGTEIEINGGHIVNTYGDVLEYSNALTNHNTYKCQVKITINGGNFSSYGNCVLSKDDFDVKIKGGTFSKPSNGSVFGGTTHFVIEGGLYNIHDEESLGKSLENNYFFAKANPEKSNLYEIIPATAVVNSWGYLSLESAIADAQSGDNVVLVRDTTESVTCSKDLTINLKKHSLGGLIADNAVVSVNAQIENNVTSITSFGTTNGGQLKILGGTYLNSVADSAALAATYVPEGYKIACVSNVEPIKWGVSNGYVAKINATEFITLSAAISAVTDSINSGTATEAGKVVTLLQDVSISSAAVLPNGAILDLNGKTLMVDEKDACIKLAAADGAIIVKNGTLSNTAAVKSADCVVLLDKKGTIQLQDVDVVAAGKYGIMSTAADAVFNLDAACSISGAKSSPVYASAATKVINAATIDKVSFGDVAMNIENSGTISMIETSASSKAFTLVNNGEATLFAGAFTGAVSLTNNTGAVLNIKDTADVNYMTTSFTNATISNAGTLNLKNGNFMTSSSISSTGTMNITGGQYVNAVYNQIKNSINTGSYDALASINAKKENAYIVVVKGTESVAKMTVGETVKYFTSVQDAFNNLPENSTPATVTLMSDASINYEGHCITLQKYHNVTLDLNGHSIYGATNVMGSSSVFENFGTLTIEGAVDGDKAGGAIYNIETNPEDYRALGKPYPSYAYNIFTNHGLLIINGGYLENQTNSNSSYIVDNQSNGYAYSPNLVVNGGRMVNNHTNAIRMFVNTDSTTLVNKVTVNGGTIEGYCAIWGQLLNSKSPGEIYINGGNFITTSKKYDPAVYGSLKKSDTQIYFTGSNQYTKCIITGGTFDDNFWIGSTVDFKISGGRFNGAIETYSNLTALSGGIYDFNNTYKGHAHIDDKPTLEGYVVDGYCMVHIGDSTTDYMYEVKPCGGIAINPDKNGGNWNDSTTWIRTDSLSSGIPNQGDIVTITGKGQGSSDTVRVYVESGDTAVANTVYVDGEGQIVVKDGATLQIGNGGIVTDNEELLPIIVEAGGVLTVGTGGVDKEEGTLTPITITHDTEKSGVFMVDPNASDALAEAEATVNVYTRSYMTNTINHWQQFASPVKGHIKITPLGVGQLDGVQSEIYNWDYATDKWLWMKTFTKTGWEGDNILLPFEAYDLINNSLPEEGGITYRFEGSLCGNNDMILNFPEHGYCVFGNSYTAPIDLNTLFEKVVNDMPQENVDPCVYVFNSEADRFESVNSLDLFLQELGIEAAFTSIAPQQAFVMNLRKGNTAQTSVDYNKSVWGNTNETKTDPIRSPKRFAGASVNLSAYLDIRVSDGKSTDKLVLVEGEAYDNTYNAGADAEKYMNSKLNLYANTEAGKLGMVATDNIVGTMLTLETAKNIQYTLTFAHVYGDLILIDHETNESITIKEGGTYTFVANANSKVINRFEIGVERKLPTVIEDSASSNKVEGIYTVLGQYVGEVADWDMLPTGVYVIDGVKVVK